ncbi:MAG: amino acid transporter substrate-binding protein [Paucimonas sp.]|nr:amino acid transporter substrate-binding protein [Paucimonas sp.]
MKRNTVTRRKAMQMIGAGAVAASGILPSKAFAQASNNTLKLASVLGLSGFYGQYGLELNRGIQIAVDAINSKGLKVADKTYKVQLETFDDKSDASTSARLVERAASDGANMMVAGIGSLIAKAIIPVAQRQRIPVIGQWAHLDNVFAGQKGNPYYFSTMPPFSGIYEPTWEQLARVDGPKLRKVVMISPNDELGALVAKRLPDDLKKYNMEVAHVEFFPPASQDFGAPLERCARHNPDILLINCYTAQTIAIFKQIQAVRFYPPSIVVEAPTHLVEGVGKAIDGVFVPAFWSPAISKTKDEFIGTSQDFARLYKAKHNAEPPDFVAACGANDVITFAMALQKARSTSDSPAILNALRNFDGETFFSAVKFNDVGLNIGAKPYSAQFQSGKLLIVGPDAVRAAAPQHPYPGWKKT